MSAMAKEDLVVSRFEENGEQTIRVVPVIVRRRTTSEQ